MTENRRYSATRYGVTHCENPVSKISPKNYLTRIKYLAAKKVFGKAGGVRCPKLDKLGARGSSPRSPTRSLCYQKTCDACFRLRRRVVPKATRDARKRFSLARPGFEPRSPGRIICIVRLTWYSIGQSDFAGFKTRKVIAP